MVLLRELSIFDIKCFRKNSNYGVCMKSYSIRVAVIVLSIVVFLTGCKDRDKILDPSDGVEGDEQSGKLIPNEYIVELKSELSSDNNIEAVTARVNDILTDYGIPKESVLSVFESSFQGFAANFDADKAELIAKDPRIQSIIQNMEFSIPIEKPSVKSSKATSAIQSAGQIIPDGVRFVGGPGNGVGKRVWIMDTGVDLDNPDLNVDKGLSADFTGTKNGGDDDMGHGTMIAGIIAAKNNEIGVVGVAAGATIVSVKVFRKQSRRDRYLEDTNPFNFSDLLTVVKGIEYITKNAKEGDVVNISFGNDGNITSHDVRFEILINQLASKKIKCVLAAGQDFIKSGRNVVHISPPRISDGVNIYTVAALDFNSIDPSNTNTSFEKKLAKWSNYGEPCNFAAPGEKIFSLSIPDSLFPNPGRGASYAAPFVAGILLLGEIGSSEVAFSPLDGKTLPIAHIAGVNYKPLPQVSSISPATPLKPEDIVTISGSSFGIQRSANFVSFNGIIPQSTDYINWSNTEIKVKVPTGSSSGLLKVNVDGKVSNEVNVIIKPVISSITPNVTSVGSIVSITGSGFGNAQGTSFVSFNKSLKLQARDYMSWSNNEIRIKLPSYVQSGNVYVSAIGFKSNEVNLTVIPAPKIPSIEWAKCYGGSGYDIATSTQQTNDGGYIVAGYTNSNDGDIAGNHGGEDCWVVKLNSSGAMQWKKTYGGSGSDQFASIQQTSDGGYICGGRTKSYDGNVSGYHGGYNADDAWVVKLNSTGEIMWQKSLGGDQAEACTQIIQTADGGYAITGYAGSYNGDSWIPRRDGVGSLDYWIIKLNSSGIFQWQKRLGGNADDLSYSLRETNDGGFVLAGSSSTWIQIEFSDVFRNHGIGTNDAWIVKVNSSGSIQWSNSLGGSSNDQANSIGCTNDGGYIVAGYSESNNGDVSENHGANDSWIVKLNSGGGIVWQKSLGGSGYENAISIQQINDGSYIVGGSSTSNNGDVTINYGSNDYWIVNVSSTGNIIWQKSLGGSEEEVITSIKQTNDGGYIVAGYTKSNDGDVTGNHGSYDYWVVKLKFP